MAANEPGDDVICGPAATKSAATFYYEVCKDRVSDNFVDHLEDTLIPEQIIHSQVIPKIWKR